MCHFILWPTVYLVKPRNCSKAKELHQELHEEQLLSPWGQVLKLVAPFRNSVVLTAFSCQFEKLSIHLFLFHVAGLGEAGDQQEAWRGLLLHRRHNRCSDRRHPRLPDEVVILSGCPLLAISEAVVQVVFGKNSKKKDCWNQMSWDHPSYFVDIGVGTWGMLGQCLSFSFPCCFSVGWALRTL